MKIQHSIDLIIVLTQKELKVKYKNSFLGYLWSIAHPLAFAFVFFIAFKIVMRVEVEDYALFLIVDYFRGNGSAIQSMPLPWRFWEMPR